MSQSTTTGLSNEDREKIDELNRNFAELMLERDMAGLARLYTADAVLMPPNHPNVSGQAAIQEYFGTFPKVIRLSATNHQIDGRGDIAYVRGSYEMTLESEGGESIDDRGKYLEIRSRQDDGSWPVALDMFSSDLES